MTGNDLRSILSSNLKSLRAKRALSQIELAEKAGISVPFRSNIERNNKWPYPETLAKLAEALDVEVNALFQEKKPRSDSLRNVLPQFKKDIEVSIHKKVSSAIDNSLDTVFAMYMAETKGEQAEK